jgi:hypothetical protein
MKSWTIGSVWQEMRDTVRADSWMFAPVAAAFVLLPNLVAARFFPDERQSIFDMPAGETMVVSLAVSLVGAIAQAFILIVLLRGSGQPVRDVLREAVRLVLPLFALSVLTGLATLAGLILFVVPGLYVIGRLAVGQAVLIEERRGIVDSLRRAWDLSNGCAWRILGFALLMLAAVLGAILLLTAVAMAAGLVFRVVGLDGVDHILVLLASAVVVSTATVYWTVGIALIYRRLTTD